MGIAEVNRKLRKLASGIKALGDLPAHYHNLNLLQSDVRLLQIRIEQVQQGVKQVQQVVEQVQQGVEQVQQGVEQVQQGVEQVQQEVQQVQQIVQSVQQVVQQVQQVVQEVLQAQQAQQVVQQVQQLEKGTAARLEEISSLLRGEIVGLDPEALAEKVAERVPRFRFLQESYSQEGEDLLLARIFEGKTTGFYVDVGAHHPLRYSNTYLFYRRGWHGINVDATPGCMEEFRRVRPHDINIEALISSDKGSSSFFLFNEPALNTVSPKIAGQRPTENPRYQVVDNVVLEMRPLSGILDMHLPRGQTIDFLNVDVEGADLNVLKSNNWERYRPNYILAELLDTEFNSVNDHEITLYLQKQGYCTAAKFVNTALFVKQTG